MEDYMNVSERIGGDLGATVLSYDPLVKATAVRYQGRGAEFEDLVQEGYLALLVLIPKCKEIEWLPLFLKNRLPGYVRAAASRLRSDRDNDVFDLECIEDVICDDDDDFEESNEIRDLLERSLSSEELDVTQALLEGFSQREIADVLGVSQQAVSSKLRKIRDKLRVVLDVER